jgi:thiaminase/transcriptional activator TenA
MKLSVTAWEFSSRIINEIKSHAFNQQLMKGTLDRSKFAYYIEQDYIYLQDFARCLAIIAAKISPNYAKKFLCYSESAYQEQEVVHQFFKQIFNFQETKLITPATLSYTSYLARICLIEQVEIGVAAILPCFWVYREVGLFINERSIRYNPYERWIETYSSKDFCATVDECINIFDALAKDATDKIKEKMIEAFYRSTCLEWHFWNDAYNHAIFDNLQPTSLIAKIEN